MIKDPKRVTIMIANDVDKKIREIQAKNIKDQQSSYSFSRTVDDQLRKSLKLH